MKEEKQWKTERKKTNSHAHIKAMSRTVGSGSHKAICMRKHIQILIFSDSRIQAFRVMIAAFWGDWVYGDTVLRHIIISTESVLEPLSKWSWISHIMD